jgi:hypothetical protein
MYVTETISLREYHFVLQTVAYRVIELQWATFAYRIATINFDNRMRFSQKAHLTL